MALSVEKLLTDAHTLILRLKEHDTSADHIIASTQALFLKVEAMKQYQEDIVELNELAKHRPRSTLVLGIAQENRQIRQLQQENRELQATLEDHQAALELIMHKYREHTVKLLHSSRVERALQDREVPDKDSMCHLMDKIDEMAGVMQKAIEVDETTGCVDKERLSQLEAENKTLRELLEICTTSRDRIIPQIPFPAPANPDKEEAKDAEGDEDDDDGDETANESDDSSDNNSTIMVSPPPIPTSVEKEVSGDGPDKTSPSPSPSSSPTVSATAPTTTASPTTNTTSTTTTTITSAASASPVKKSPERTVTGKDTATTATKSGGKNTSAGKGSMDGKKTIKAGSAAAKKATGAVGKRDSPATRKSPSVDTKRDSNKSASKTPTGKSTFGSKK